MSTPLDAWDRQQIKEVLDQLKKLPDWERYPLPEFIHKEFDIPMPPNVCMSFMDFMAEHKKSYYHSQVDATEERKGDGIVRPMPEPDPELGKTEVRLLKDETDAESRPTTPTQKEDSIESNEKEHQG